MLSEGVGETNDRAVGRVDLSLSSLSWRALSYGLDLGPMVANYALRWLRARVDAWTVGRIMAARARTRDQRRRGVGDDGVPYDEAVLAERSEARRRRRAEREQRTRAEEDAAAAAFMRPADGQEGMGGADDYYDDDYGEDERCVCGRTRRDETRRDETR